jgi:hypothetical protein
MKFLELTEGVKTDFERPLTMDEDFSASAVGLPANGGMEVYSLNGRVVELTGFEVALAAPKDWGPRFAGCRENVTS